MAHSGIRHFIRTPPACLPSCLGREFVRRVDLRLARAVAGPCGAVGCFRPTSIIPGERGLDVW